MAYAGMGGSVRAYRVRPGAEPHRPAPRPQGNPQKMNDSAMIMEARTEERLAAPPAKIDIRGLDFFYGKHHALKHVDVAMPANMVTAIIGPSGCGKSTLLRTINRIYELYPDQRAEGEIVIDGRNVLDRSYSLSDLRRRVGMVFQKPTPFASS